MRLEVHQQLKGDIYRDIVRIPEEHRRDTQGRIVREGTIVKIIVPGEKSKVVWLRGMEGETRPWIQRWTPEFGQLAKVGSRPRRRSLECHGRDGVILLS